MTEDTNLINENLKVTRFSPEKCEAADIETVAMFDDRLSLSCLRVLKIAKLAKKKKIFSIRSIGIMCGISHVSAMKSLRRLVELGYLVRSGQDYFINTGFILSNEVVTGVTSADDEVVTKVTKVVTKVTDAVTKVTNNIYNNTNNNINKYTPTLEIDISNEKHEEIKLNASTEPQQPEEPKTALVLPSKEKSKFFFLTAKEKERVVARYRAELGELNFKKYLPLALEWAERYYEDHPKKKFKSPTRVLMDWPLSKAKQEMMLDMKLAKEKQR